MGQGHKRELPCAGLTPGTGRDSRTARHLCGPSSQNPQRCQGLRAKKLSLEASATTGTPHTLHTSHNHKPKRVAFPFANPAPPTYFNDSRDTRQGGEFVGRSFAGCGGHETQEGGLGGKGGHCSEKSCPSLRESPQAGSRHRQEAQRLRSQPWGGDPGSYQENNGWKGHLWLGPGWVGRQRATPSLRASRLVSGGHRDPVSQWDPQRNQGSLPSSTKPSSPSWAPENLKQATAHSTQSGCSPREG